MDHICKFCSVVVIIVVVSVICSLVVSLALELGFANVSHAQTTPMVTPQQKAAICHPNDKFVNTTESIICGFPKSTPPINSTSSTTTASSSSSSSSSLPPVQKQFPKPTLAVKQNHPQRFTATLSGNQEVPPKKTSATGSANFILTPSSSTIRYTLHVTNLDKVSMVHINSGKIGMIGPVVTTLSKPAIQTATTKTTVTTKNAHTALLNVIISQGTITSSNLQGPLKGKQITDLVKLIHDGNAYVNIQTKKNPKGEIRGQIS
jgi:hypothetical protein